jgi:hypothetical protein
MFTQILSSISLAVVVSGIKLIFTVSWKFLTLLCIPAAITTIVPPCSQGQWDDPSYTPTNGTYTDTSNITSTVYIVYQKAGATEDASPNQPVADTAVTAVDGIVTEAGTNSATRRSFLKRSEGFAKRSPSDFELVFYGTGTGLNDRDASVEGTAYLTYSLVSNATYNVDDCLAECDQVETCGE